MGSSGLTQSRFKPVQDPIDEDIISESIYKVVDEELMPVLQDEAQCAEFARFLAKKVTWIYSFVK